MSSFASFKLVLHSTGMATKVLQALSTEDQASPRGQLVVLEAMSNIARALRTVNSQLAVQEEFTPERPSGVMLKAALQATEEDDYDLQPRTHALIDQEIRGTKTLLLEVVRRAAYDWVLYRTSTRLLHKKLAEDAYTWLFEEEAGHPNWDERNRQGKSITAFLTICSELDLDAKTVRNYVRRLTVKNVMSVGRPAEYRRRDTSSVRTRALPVAGDDSTGTDDF